MAALEWQKNTNGTHFAEYGTTRYSVSRAPGLRSWYLKENGEFRGSWPTVNHAKTWANHLAANSEAGR